MSECRERLEAEGLDLSAYNSVTSAQDLDNLGRTLGYEQWNLCGVSYGTRLALTAARDTPRGIRSMLLDSMTWSGHHSKWQCGTRPTSPTGGS